MLESRQSVSAGGINSNGKRGSIPSVSLGYVVDQPEPVAGMLQKCALCRSRAVSKLYKRRNNFTEEGLRRVLPHSERRWVSMGVGYRQRYFVLQNGVLVYYKVRCAGIKLLR